MTEVGKKQKTTKTYLGRYYLIGKHFGKSDWNMPLYVILEADDQIEAEKYLVLFVDYLLTFQKSKLPLEADKILHEIDSPELESMINKKFMEVYTYYVNSA